MDEREQHTWIRDQILEIIDKSEPFNSRLHTDYQSSRACELRSRSATSNFESATQLRQTIEAETR